VHLINLQGGPQNLSIITRPNEGYVVSVDVSRKGRLATGKGKGKGKVKGTAKAQAKAKAKAKTRAKTMTKTETKANAKVVVTHRLFNPIWIYYKP
jgi:carbon monoxide dehydrogenase subunit G